MFERFKRYKIGVEGVSEFSISQYEQILNNFAKFNNKDINDDNFIIHLTANDIKAYIEYLTANNKENTTKNKFLAVIKTFCSYLCNEENIDMDAKIFLIKKIKVKHKEPLWLNRDEIESYIKGIPCSRTRAMVRMLCETGMRFSEMANIKIEDFMNGSAIITGKGNKQRVIYFGNKDLQNDVYKYILGKRKNIIDKNKVDTNLLFINNKGHKVIAQNFIRSLKTCAKSMARGNEMSPHKLRHSFITNALLGGEPISVVRDAVGHSSIMVTNNYAHSTQKSIENLMNNGRSVLTDDEKMLNLI